MNLICRVYPYPMVVPITPLNHKMGLAPKRAVFIGLIGLPQVMLANTNVRYGMYVKLLSDNFCCVVFHKVMDR